MNTIPEHRALLEENRPQWQQVVDYLQSQQRSSDEIEKIEQLVLASPYALLQLLRNPELAGTLPGLEKFTLMPELLMLLRNKRLISIRSNNN